VDGDVRAVPKQSSTRGREAEFLDLICADEELLVAEFEERTRAASDSRAASRKLLGFGRGHGSVPSLTRGPLGPAPDGHGRPQTCGFPEAHARCVIPETTRQGEP
jgi:hypothetical protein